MHIIFDSRECEEIYVYEEEVQNVQSMFEELIEQYEKRYKTSVIYIGISGTVGVWTGDHRGGKVIRPNETILHSMRSVDTVQLLVDQETMEFYIKGIHHDGTHLMQLEFLTDSKLQKDFPSLYHHGELTIEEADKLSGRGRSKVKYNKLCEGYFGKIKRIKKEKEVEEVEGNELDNKKVEYVFPDEFKNAQKCFGYAAMQHKLNNSVINFEEVEGYLIILKDVNGNDFPIRFRNRYEYSGVPTDWIAECPSSFAVMSGQSHFNLSEALNNVLSLIEKGVATSERLERSRERIFETFKFKEVEPPTPPYTTRELTEEEFEELIKEASIVKVGDKS